jgi:hypothetical protein
MELVERVSVEKATFLKSMLFNDFQKLKKFKNKEEAKAQFKLLTHFCDGVIKGRGECKRLYGFTDKTAQGASGRLYCGGSVQGLPKQVRGFLMSETTDIDMVNAHPTILKWLCDKHNVPCANLTMYLQNRDHYITQIQNGKHEFLCALNRDTRNLKIKNPFFIAFDKEMKDIQKQFYTFAEYNMYLSTPDISYNWNGSTLNRILCKYENDILQTAIGVLTKNNIDIAVLMFDGCMIYGEGTPSLLDEIITTVNTKFEGLNMSWKYKPHETNIEIPDDWVDTEIKIWERKEKNGDTLTTPDERVIPFKAWYMKGIDNDLEAAEKVYAMYPYWVFCHDDLYVYDYETGIYTTNLTIIKKIVSKFSKYLHLSERDDKGNDFINTKKSYGNTSGLLDKMLCLLKTLNINNHWMKKNQTSALGKILFNNGIFDFKTRSFSPKFNPSLVFFGKIHADYNTDIDESYLKSIKQRIFYDTLGKDAGKYFIEQLSRGLSGEVMKRILFAIGPSNSGKGVLTTSLMLALGDYCGSFNAENLAYRETTQDEAAVMRWALLIANKRIILSNEIKQTVELDGNKIKKIASGGDTLIGRTHCKEEQEFITQFLPVVLCNDINKITPYDDAVDNRVRCLSYTKNFVEMPTNEFELKMDDHIKEEIKTEKYQQHLRYLLMFSKWTNIEPQCVKNSKKEWFDVEERDVVKQFWNTFELCEGEFVPSSDIVKWLEGTKSKISMQKFGLDMKKWKDIHKKEFGVKVKKISGKSINVWDGVRVIPCCELDVEPSNENI